jgi:hypothetical protein
MAAPSQFLGRFLIRRAPLLIALGVACVTQIGYAAEADGKKNQTDTDKTPVATDIRLRVRVHDVAGKPLAGIKGTVFKLTANGGGGMFDSGPKITQAGTTSPSTAEGLLESPALPLKAAYVLELHADGYAPESTRWTHPRQSGTVDLPPVALRRLGSVAGTLVDRQGKGIAKATVIQAGDGTKRLEAVTDANGHFDLAGVPEGQAIVCFDAAGFRFHGAVLACPSHDVRSELERTSDPRPRVLAPAADVGHPWSAEKRAAEVRRISEPMIARVLEKSSVNENDFSMVLSAARRDPERILAHLDRLKFDHPNSEFSIRYALGAALLQQGKTERAFKMIDGFKQPVAKIQAYLYWFQSDSVRKKSPDAHRQALAKARALLAMPIAPQQRPFFLCELATQLWELGDHDGARKLLDECVALFEKMPEESDGRPALQMQLAIAVSRFDFARTKKLAADLEPNQAIRLASEVARFRPQETESLLAEVPSDLSLAQLRGAANTLPNLCFRVAKVDPAAAERLSLKFSQVPQPKTDAEKMFGIGGSFGLNLSKEFIEFQVTKLKAGCYSLIAEGAAAHDPVAARRALEQGIALVKPLRTGYLYPTSQFYHTPAGLMALFVPVADRIDPALAREVFWRTLSLRVALPGESHERDMLEIDTSQLAGLVRFYDRPLAELMLAPLVARTRGRSFSGAAANFWVVRALGLDSPERAVAFVDSLCDLADAQGSSPRATAEQVIAGVLSAGATWDDSREKRLHAALGGLRSVYGFYVNEE